MERPFVKTLTNAWPGFIIAIRIQHARIRLEALSVHAVAGFMEMESHARHARHHRGHHRRVLTRLLAFATRDIQGMVLADAPMSTSARRMSTIVLLMPSALTLRAVSPVPATKVSQAMACFVAM
eukprot:Rmarinus@m.5243